MAIGNKIKPQVGRPGYSPTLQDRGKVMGFVTAGFTHAQIAEFFNTDVITLKRHFKEELLNTHLFRTGKVANKLYKMAIGGDVKALELYLKCKAQWSAYKPPETNTALEGVTSLLQKLVDQKTSKTD